MIYYAAKRRMERETMKTYTIVQKTQDLDWSVVPEAAIDCCQWGYSADVSAKAQLCYDQDAIYVRLCAREPEIRAEEKGQTGLPYLDSCLEFFLCPMEDSNTYFNIEMNPNCTMYLGIGSNSQDLIRLLLPDEGNLDAQAQRTRDGWEITYRVPVSLIKRFFPDFVMRSGVKMRGNFYKCGDKTKVPHYYAWNPIENEILDFHQPQWYGQLCLA